MVLANAKINLFLAITARQIGAYHELIALNIPSDICDQITITKSEDWKFECSDQSLLKNNTIQKLIAQLGPIISNKYHIFLDKNIPILSGFGGGSSDATALLKFLNDSESLNLNYEQLLMISKKIGADCPFFIRNAPAVVSGIGDIVSPLEAHIAQNLKKYQIIIFKPPFDIETKVAYQKLRTTHKHLYISYPKATKLLNNLLREILNFSPKLSLFNTFSELIFPEHPELNILKKNLEKFDVNMMLSGTGSGCFCIFQDPNKTAKIIDLIKNSFKKEIFIKETTF